MATDFPNSPSNGATHTFGGTTYTYSSSVGAWTAPGSSGGGASVTVSETAPSSPSVGDLWFDPSVLKTFVFYNDGTANQWVQNNPTGSGGGGSAGASVTASDTAPSSPSAGDLWYKSDTNGLYVYYNDGDSSQWVGVSGPAGPAGADGAAGAAATGYGQVPIVYTEPPTSTQQLTGGSTSTVQMQAVDPEGTAITYGIAYANSTNARPTQLSADTTINQSTGVFTFTASNNSAHAGTFKARLSASDGITHATRFVNFVLNFNVGIELLLIAGGGGGNDNAGGGGGAGGLVLNTSYTALGGTTYNIVVGTGGSAQQAQGTRGDAGVDSTFSQGSTLVYTATGGGGGGPYPNAGSGDGGSGGGAGRATTASDKGSSTQASYGGLGFGFDGGEPNSGSGAGGGGGAGGVGANGQYYSNYAAGSGANGGSGKAISITGSSVNYAPGGPGAGHDVAVGNYVNGSATSYGAGGAGGQYGGLAAAFDGADGVCIIAAPQAASAVTGTYALNTSGRSGYHVYTFTGNGSITF